MEALTPPLNPAALSPADLEVWSAAYRKVSAYLRAYRLQNALVLNELTLRVLARAKARWENDPARPPVSVAAAEVDAVLDEWYARLFAGEELSPGLAASRGRVCLLLTDLAERHPEYLLAEKPLPPALAAELRAVRLHTGPQVRMTSMRPEKMDFGPIPELAADTWEFFARWPLLKSAVLLALFVVFVGTLYTMVT